MAEKFSRVASASTEADDLRQLRRLIEAVTDYAIYMLDAGGQVRSWHTGGSRIKGYEAGEVLGQHYRIFFTDEDVASGLPERNLETARIEGRCEAEGWRKRKDGSLFWASVVLDAIYEDGDVVGFAKVTRDITERFEAQKSLEHAHAAMIASQRMEAVGRLTLGIAHDFNNLLGVIINAVDLVALRAEHDSATKTLLGTALRAADRGSLLTRQLLAFARVQHLSPSMSNLSELVAKSTDLFMRACGPSTSCHFSLEPSLPPISVDEAQFEAAVLNLIVNAADAMPEGGVIEISSGLGLDVPPGAAGATEALYTYVQVADTGLGMTPDVLAQAAEPFFTTKEVGKGSGLGLSQVYGFLAQSGGFVRISSEVAVGTTVRLSFPVVQQ